MDNEITTALRRLVDAANAYYTSHPEFLPTDEETKEPTHIEWTEALANAEDVLKAEEALKKAR
jgi:hypothetical protein